MVKSQKFTLKSELVHIVKSAKWARKVSRLVKKKSWILEIYLVCKVYQGLVCVDWLRQNAKILNYHV